MKILVISDAAPARNGAGSYYQDLLEHLDLMVARAVLCSPTIDQAGNWQGGFALPLPGDSTQKLCVPNIWKLNRLFNELHPDIVVIATPGIYGMAGSWLARRKNIPFLTGMHTSFEQLAELYWPASLRGKIVERYFRYSNGFLFRHAESVLGNAEPVLEQVRGMGAAAVKLVGTPISSSFITPGHAPYSGNLESCLFAGRLAKEKNIGELLTAAAAFPTLRFSIAGDGPLKELVASAAAKHDNLHYLGWLNREQLREAVDRHDALLLPSHFETFGTIALEAMARERLALVSRGCGISNWEELAPGLIIMEQNSGLSGSLRSVLQMSREQRGDIARAASEAARNWHDEVLRNWCHILADTIENFQHERVSNA